jgi:hypothetical protein
MTTPTANTVTIPRALWGQIYWALELYADPKNWECYSHQTAGIMPAPVALIGHASAARVLDAITPALFEQTLAAYAREK